MHIILASQSPSRASVLRSAGVDPVIRPSDVDEDAVRAGLVNAKPGEVVQRLACAKARTIEASEGAVVVGCDSMLLDAHGQLSGKPHTQAATIARWRAQAGTTATLLTGHCFIDASGAEYTETTATEVTFAAASDADITAYAATGEPLECAGAFTLEALGGWFIDSIAGDPSSVIGISLPALRRGLYAFGYHVSEFWASEAR